MIGMFVMAIPMTALLTTITLVLATAEPSNSSNKTGLATNTGFEVLQREGITSPINLSLSTTFSDNRTNGSLNASSASSDSRQNLTDAEIVIINQLEDLSHFLKETSLAIHNESALERRLLQESNDRLKSELRAMKTSVESFWSVRAADLVSLALAAIAGWLTIPPILFGTFYKPKIEVFLTFPGIFHYERNTTFSWIHFTNVGINIRNKTPRRFSIEIQINTDKYSSVKPEALGLFPNDLMHTGLLGGYHLKDGFWVKSIDLPLSGNSTNGYTFPLQPKPEDCFIEIIVYPRLRLSEFRPFPRTFGEVDLKPIKASYKVTKEDKS